MNAKELYDEIYQREEKKLRVLALRIKKSPNPSEEITNCITEQVMCAYKTCIDEMEHDKVLKYTINTSLKVVEYSYLRQMGIALKAAKAINKQHRAACNYGEPYYHVAVVGLSKVTVEVKIKRLFW